MKKTIFILFSLLTLIKSANAQWLDQDAAFRMKLIPQNTGKATVVELGKLLLPGDIKNGVSAFNSSGEKIYYYLNPQNFTLYVGPVKQNETFYIYFGYKNKRGYRYWPSSAGPIPKSDSLYLTIVQAWLNNQPEEKVKAEREKARKELESIKNKLNTKKIEKLEQKIELREQRMDRAIETFFKTKRRVYGTVAVDRVLYDRLPLKKYAKKYSIAAMFKGQLKITEAGTYTFAVNSEQGSYIIIDGKVVVAWLYDHRKSPKWGKTAEITLEKGFHDFRYYYQKNSKTNFACAAWKKPGWKNFQILRSTDFSTAIESEIESLKDKSGNKFPIVNYSNKGSIVLEGEKYASWIECYSVPEDIYWNMGNSKLPSSDIVQFLIKEDDNFINLACSSKGSNFQSFPVTLPTKPDQKKRVEPELNLKLWTPDFLYDDELLSMDVEICSGIRDNVELVLAQQPNAVTSVFGSTNEWLHIPSRPASVYAPSTIYKRTLPLDGKSISEDLEVDYSISIPPVKIDSLKLAFTPITKCGGVKDSPRGLIDSKGRKVVPLLHRKTLAEKRTWAFPKAIMREFVSAKKVIIISDDFGQTGKTFRKTLKDELIKHEVSLEFLEWNKSAFGSYMYSSIGNFVEKINNSDAKLALLIPSSKDNEAGIPIRHQHRTLAAILETLQANQNIKIVVVTSPFPALQEHESEKLLTSSVFELAREYETEFIDVNKYIRNLPNWENNYRFHKGSDAVMETHPVQIIDTIVDKLLKDLRIR